MLWYWPGAAAAAPWEVWRMRLAVLGASSGETRYLCERIQAYSSRAGCRAEVCPVYDLGSFWDGFGPGVYQGVLMGLGDTAGFLAARRIREQDSGCRLVILDDTPRFAIHCLRIHAVDFLVRPFENEQLQRSLGRLFGL